MNYDLLTKLARLANNNPNENEANLAARKVCKLLAEGNFTFTNWSPEPKSNPADSRNYRSASNPNDNPFADFFRARQNQWEDFGKPPKQEKTASEKLREEQERQRKARTEGSWTYESYDESTPFINDLFDMINKIMEERKARGYAVDPDSDENYWINELHWQQQAKRDREPFRTKRQGPFGSPSVDQTLNWEFDINGKRTRKNEERLLKCRICKNSKLTKFVGLAELYECNTCQWTAYEAKK